VFWIFPIEIYLASEFVSDFDIRILDLFRWLPFGSAQDGLGAITLFATSVRA